MAESSKKRKGTSSTTVTAGHCRHGPSEAPTTPILPSLSSSRSSTLSSSDDQRLWYNSQFSSRIILDPKYLHTNFFNDETFDCYQVFQNSGLVDFMSLKLPYYPELVKVFYSNLKIQDGIISSEVHGISMIIDQSLFFSLTKLPSQGAPFEGTIVDDWKFDYSSHDARRMVCNDQAEMTVVRSTELTWLVKRSFAIGAGAVTSFGYRKDHNGQWLKKDVLPLQDERTPSPPPQRDDSSALMTEVLSKLRGLHTYTKKNAIKLITSLKQMDAKFGVSTLLDLDHHFAVVIRVLREVILINLLVFQFILSFLTMASSNSKSTKWLLVAKLMQKGVAVTYKTWKEVPVAQKDLIWKDIQAKFEIPEASGSRTKKKVLQTVGEQWRQF
ncbi:hypothetical protein HKD37_16G045680 [Glycine soja]